MLVVSFLCLKRLVQENSAVLGVTHRVPRTSFANVSKLCRAGLCAALGKSLTAQHIPLYAAFMLCVLYTRPQGMQIAISNPPLAQVVLLGDLRDILRTKIF